MKISEGSGRLANKRSIPPNQWGSGIRNRAPETALIVTPITARRTTGASLSRTASGSLKPTRTSKAANTVKTRTISTKAARSAMASGRAEIGATHVPFAILSVNRADQASSAAARSDETPPNLNGPSGRPSGRAKEGRGQHEAHEIEPALQPPRPPAILPLADWLRLGAQRGEHANPRLHQLVKLWRSAPCNPCWLIEKLQCCPTMGLTFQTPLKPIHRSKRPVGAAAERDRGADDARGNRCAADALIAARMSVWRGRPPVLAEGIGDSNRAHCASVRSLGNALPACLQCSLIHIPNECSPYLRRP
jgi:hypothetical protein